MPSLVGVLCHVTRLYTTGWQLKNYRFQSVPIPISTDFNQCLFSFDCNARNTKFFLELDYVISDVFSKFDAISIKIVHFRAIYLGNWAVRSHDYWNLTRVT